jgi:hypothetical protein
LCTWQHLKLYVLSSCFLLKRPDNDNNLCFFLLQVSKAYLILFAV